MGRVKLKIKRLENSSSRQVTYSKRKAGILKKAKELSILCDIDLLLIMFAPNAKPTICIGDRSNIEKVVERFAQVSLQERAKRKLESLEALKKTFKKLDHDVNIQEFLGSSEESVEDLTNHLRSLHGQLRDVQTRLRLSLLSMKTTLVLGLHDLDALRLEAYLMLEDFHANWSSVPYPGLPLLGVSSLLVFLATRSFLEFLHRTSNIPYL